MWRRRHCSPRPPQPLYLLEGPGALGGCCPARRDPGPAAVPREPLGRSLWGLSPSTLQANTAPNPFYRPQEECQGLGEERAPGSTAGPAANPPRRPSPAQPPRSVPARGSWGDPAPPAPLQPRCQQPPGTCRGERCTATAPVSPPSRHPFVSRVRKAPVAGGAGGPAQQHGHRGMG